MENVILNGKSPSGITYEEAQRLSLDIWEPSLIERLESSKPKIEDANMFDVSHQRSETTVTELPEESAPTFNTAQESLQSLLHSYVNLIYGEVIIFAISFARSHSFL